MAADAGSRAREGARRACVLPAGGRSVVVFVGPTPMVGPTKAACVTGLRKMLPGSGSGISSKDEKLCLCDVP